nr:MAG TPA: hypothetical protein [Caudoviricetes sp.]
MRILVNTIYHTNKPHLLPFPISLQSSIFSHSIQFYRYSNTVTTM